MLLAPVIGALMGAYLGGQVAPPPDGQQVEGVQQPPSTPIEEKVVEPEINPPRILIIPKIEVEAEVEFVGLDGEGRMDVPQQVSNVAWFSLGAKPGEAGNAVIAGHLDDARGQPAVFYRLNSLNPGDEIMIVDNGGKSYKFQVIERVVYPTDSFPLEKIFGEGSKPRLNLITCEGTFNRLSRNYSHRTVIFSELAGSSIT